jgi:PHD/YefM family antitoxin component YafN of YafNO toxin-antitoxin module
MVNLSLKTNVRYVTNTNGETTDVLVPLELWQQLINTLQDPGSGLAWVDEHEPNAQLLADLQESIKQAAAGQTFPVSQLWVDIEA